MGLLDQKKTLIGMIHLAGNDRDDKLARAIEETKILQEEGFDAVIVENYHGTINDVQRTLEKLSENKLNITIGVNILPNEFTTAFPMAQVLGGSFIQLDYVSGSYINGPTQVELDLAQYLIHRARHPKIKVLGGVWPKYYTPVDDSNLEMDLREATQRCDAIVVTGAGTGKETPIEKIMQFRKHIGNFPLIIGAGLTSQNAAEQLEYADGAIIGSALKFDYDTSKPIDINRVRNLLKSVGR